MRAHCRELEQFLHADALSSLVGRYAAVLLRTAVGDASTIGVADADCGSPRPAITMATATEHFDKQSVMHQLR